VIAEAEVELTPAEVWLLGRAEAGAIPVDALEAGEEADRGRLRDGMERLRGRDLVETTEAPASLTASGIAIRARLLAARERSLAGLVADWEPEGPELDAVIARLSEELCHSDEVPIAISGSGAGER
jgi:hypothetical protein